MSEEKVVVYILQDSIEKENLFLIADKFSLQIQNQEKDYLKMNYILPLTLTIISLFGYHYSNKARKKGILRLYGKSSKLLIAQDFLEFLLFVIITNIFVVVNLVFLNVVKYPNLMVEFLKNINFSNFIVFFAVMTFSIGLTIFEKINNLTKNNIKNKLFGVINYIGLFIITMLYLYNTAFLVNDITVFREKLNKLENVQENMKSVQKMHFLNDSKMIEKINRINFIDKDVKSFTEQYNDKYYYMSNIPPEMMNEESNFKKPIILVSSGFIFEKFGEESKNLYFSENMIFMKQDDLAYKSEVENNVKALISMTKRDNKKENSENIKFYEKSSSEMENLVLVPNSIRSVDSERKQSFYEITSDVAYVYIPGSIGSLNFYSIYLRNNNQDYNQQINSDFINFFKDQGQPIFIKEEIGNLFDGKISLYDETQEQISKGIERINKQILQATIMITFATIIIIVFINYYLKQNILTYAIKKTMGHGDIVANASTVKILLLTIFMAMGLIVIFLKLTELYNAELLNTLILAVALQLIYTIIAIKQIAFFKKKKNNTAYYINGGDL